MPSIRVRPYRTCLRFRKLGPALPAKNSSMLAIGTTCRGRSGRFASWRISAFGRSVPRGMARPRKSMWTGPRNSRTRKAPTPSIPTCGQAWGRNTNCRKGSRSSGRIRSTKSFWRRPESPLYSCIVCPRIAARKLPIRSSSPIIQSFSSKPPTGCRWKKPSLLVSWRTPMKQKVKKVVLAYSGGLDTSIIIPWLKENYNCEIIAMAGNIGQDDELNGLEEKAIRTGATKCYVEDLRHEFVTDYLWPLVRSGAMYESKHLLWTSIARPLLAKRQVEVALEEGADALAHGCTGKGNDQVRFELTYKAFAPHLKIIAPWREWNIRSRHDAIAYAHERKIPITATAEKIYSRDSNIWHMSHEGGILEDPSQPPPDDLFMLTLDPRFCPEGESEITIDFEQGIPVGLNGYRISPVQLLEDLNEIAGTNGIGRADVVENRVVGMKSRGVYETPGGTLILAAHRELESMTLDRQTLYQKQMLSMTYAQLVYEGQWFTPLREALDAFFAKTQEVVTGSVTMTLYRGTMAVKSRNSPFSLYRQDIASFDTGSYNHHDAEGFINLLGLPAAVRSRLMVNQYETMARSV